MSRFHHHTLPVLIFVTAFTASPSYTQAFEIAEKALEVEPAQMTARGVLIAGQSADIAAGMAGRLTATPYKSGQYVSTGAVLAEFDCDRQRAELKSRRAAHATQSLKYDNQAELLKMGAAGALDVSIARSERDQIAAEITALEIALKDCTVYAPFPGFISARHIDAFETAQLGQTLISINRAGTTEISVIAPSDWAGWVKSGKKFTLDPVSQTIEITARLTGKHKGRPGMSGVAVFTGK